MIRYFIFPLILLVSYLANCQPIVINEIQSSNNSTIADVQNDYPDWIELYNASDSAVNLNNWSLSDDSNQPYKWFFPEIFIQPDSFLLIFASGKGSSILSELHTNFKINSDGEDILLNDDSGLLTDHYEPIILPDDNSYGRLPDGTNNFGQFLIPTPGYSNNLSDTVQTAYDTIFFSQPAGLYENDFFLTLTNITSDTRIYYTIDGSTPTSESILYGGSIKIYNRENDPNKLSLIPTNINDWAEPKETVFKGTVVKAAVYLGSTRISEIVTNSYFVDKSILERYKVPIVSISTDANSFFSADSGIYVRGCPAEDDDWSCVNYYQRGSNWEREVFFELFNKDGEKVVNQYLGARLHGESSRSRPQKSLRLYARTEYGKKYINYKLFPNKTLTEFKRIILRTPISTDSYSMFKDELCHDIVKNMNMDIQAFTPSVVFINGEYWGIFSIRERQDKYYVESNYNYDPDNLDILSNNPFSDELIEVSEGDNIKYNELIDFVRNNSLTINENYDYVKGKIDINNFIDYQLVQLYFANTDWPENNIKYWCPRTPDGKWRWFFYDCDKSMLQFNNNQIIEYSREHLYSILPEWYKVLFSNLMLNDEFRSLFTQKMIFHITTTFDPEKIIERIEEFEEQYEPLMVEHINRWNSPVTFKFWTEKVRELKTYIVKRPAIMLNQLVASYGIPFTIFPNPCNGEVNVKIDLVEGLDVSITIFDTRGRLVHVSNPDILSDFESRNVLISDIESGVYILQINYGDLTFSKKLVVLN